MKRSRVLLVVALLLLITAVAPQILEIPATAILAYILLFGMATIGWFVIPMINAVDDRIVPEKRIPERIRMVIAIVLGFALAFLQNFVAWFLLLNTFSPLRPWAERLGQIEPLLTFPTLGWIVWGGLSYLVVYLWRESKLA